MDLRIPDLAALEQRRSEKWALQGPGVLSSTIAEMDFPLAPPITEALRAAIDRHDLGYATPASLSLRHALAGFAHRRLGWEIDPEQVTLFPDVMDGLVELTRLLVPPGGAVAFATPGYPPFFAELPFAAARVEQVPLRPDRSYDLARLAEAIDAGVRALVLVNPHNPLGRVLPGEELSAIADLCAERGVWVLADEIHAPLVLPGASPTPFLETSDAARECGIALTSASKAFNVAGLKAAFAVTASERARDAVARLPPLFERAGQLGLVAAEAAFTEGDEWLDAVLAQLDRNRSRLGELLAATPIEWIPPQASYLAWLDCRALGLGDDPAAVFLERGHVAFARGLDYGPQGAGFVRLNFGTSPDLLEEMVRRLGMPRAETHRS
jgi:cystathionine beta-lyase